MISKWQAAARTLTATAALVALAVEPAHAQSERLADTSIEETGEAERRLLLDVTLNGLRVGVLQFIESQGRILIPAQTARALRIRNDANEVLDPDTIAQVSYDLNRQLGIISLRVPASQMSTLTVVSDLVPAAIALSPETAGVFVNYDVAVRKHSGHQRSSIDYGGLAVVQAFAPDFIANGGWSYQSARLGAGSGPIRLDSFLTWRPAVQRLAVSIGDALSMPGATARPFRFIGVSAGTDYSAVPNWSSRPIPSISGTAQPASSIDLYVNGLRRDRLPTAGGPFNLILPPGNYMDTTRIVVTDVTGGVVEIPLNPPSFDLDLLQEGLLLWSAGLGRPRFNWGSRSNDYLDDTYGYGNLRYGINNRMTLNNHVEVGQDLTEIEAEIKALVTPDFGFSGSIAHSWVPAGQGTFVEAGTVLAMSDNLFLTANVGRSFGEFHDAVSWSARSYDREHGEVLSRVDLPPRSSFDARISWQASNWLTLSSSYRRLTFQDKSEISFSTLSANANISRGATAYLTATNSFDDVFGNSFSISIGISFLLNASLNGSVSATRQESERFGQAHLARPLGQDRGSYGWHVSQSSSSSGTYVNGEARVRTGHGIPAIGHTRFAGQSQTYLNARGAAGIVAGHPFTSDPVHGGIIIADVGQPDVPVLLNGYETTRSRRDGLAAIAVDVAGTPQTIEIDDSNLPLSAIASNTRQIVTIREGGGSTADFDVQSSASGAIVLVNVNGKLPTIGTEVLTATGAIPIDSKGRAWIPTLEQDAVLILELPDGQRCSVRTKFDGKGGPGRIIGPLDCRIPL